MVNKDELCGALIEKEGFWVCVWGSRDKPPVFQKLSKKLNEARKICDVCMASRLPKSHALARLYLITAAFKCNQCLEVNFYEQRQRRMIHPVECPKCGFGVFEFIHERSTFIDSEGDFFMGSEKF